MRLFKKIYWDLMTKYFLLVVAAISCMFLSFFYIEHATDRLLVEYIEFITEKGSRDISFDKASMTLTVTGKRSEGTRLEILEDYQVIYSEGAELGGEIAYSPEIINFIIQRQYNLLSQISYLAEYIPFTGVDGKYYALLIKKPKSNTDSKAKLGVVLPEYLRGTKLESDMFVIIRRGIIMIAIILCFIALAFSQLTISGIIRPIQKLQEGLKNVDEGRLNTHLDFTANKEFEEVRDAFNRMTKKLDQVEKENIKLQEGKKQFILDLSHDLRTPITTIKGYAQAISNNMVEDEETKTKYLNYIYKKSETMAKLINKLFDYSKLENAQHQLEKKERDIANCFRNAIIEKLDKLESKSFQISIDIPDEMIMFKCDSTEIERAIGNIISNQMKYNPKGTKVFYQLKKIEDQIIIILQDDGIGIEKEVLDNIFDVMVRGDKSRHGMEGTGLGLSISKKVVELHGGTIKVFSTVGEGTRFEITFSL